MKMNFKFLYFLNVVGLLAMIIINAMANLLPINDQRTDTIASQYDNLFMPAEFTFNIWSIIFAGLIAFVIYLGVGLKRNKPVPELVLGQLGIVFFLSCIANLGWIIAWHFEQFTLTIIFSSTLLLALIDLNKRIRTISSENSTQSDFSWFVRMPFGLYLGWMCIAVLSNVTVFLHSNEWHFGLSESLWSLMMIIASGFIALWLLSRFRLISAAMAVAWGIAGILFKRLNQEIPVSIQVVSVLMLVLIGIGIARIYRKKQILKTTNQHG